MPWKRSEHPDQYHEGKVIKFANLKKNGKLGKMVISLYISSTGMLSIFHMKINNGIETFHAQHPDINPKEIGYVRNKTVLVLKVLDNGADRNETVEGLDLTKSTQIANAVSHSILDRKKLMLNIIQLLVNEHDFSEIHQQKLQQLIEEACTFLGAVKLTQRRIEKDERFWVLTHANEKSQAKAIAELGKESAELVYGYATNLQSAMNKLHTYASGEPILNFTVVEFEILMEEKKYIALLKSTATYLLALHREFPNEIISALANQARSDDTQSYTKIIQSGIGGKQEQADQSNSSEKTPLIGNVGAVPEITEPEKSEQPKQEEPADTDCRSPCTIL